jgi:hypothetical protein
MKIPSLVGLIVLLNAACTPPRVEVPEIKGPTFTPSSRRAVSAIAMGELPAGVRPPVRIHNLSENQTLWTMRGLSLKLGPITGPSGNGSALALRYMLVDPAKAVLASAESGWTGEDLEGRINILEDPATMTLLIAEEHDGGASRTILFRAATSNGTPTPSVWTLRYIRIPIRRSPVGFDQVPELMGIKGDKLFVNQGGTIYALPIDALKSDPANSKP